MPETYFLSASGDDQVAELQDSLRGERLLWQGRCAVAEYAFDEPASLPRWTLPEETEVAVTETRVVYLDPARRVGGELHWPWPQHLRVQPGNRETGRAATVTQIQLVCSGPGGVFPALVFAGGELGAVGDADRLANVLRQAIARFRVENATELGLSMPQSRMLSRLVIAPEFSNYQGGEGQTVSLLGAVSVALPAVPAPAQASPAAVEPRTVVEPAPVVEPEASWSGDAEVAAAAWGADTDEAPFLDGYFPVEQPAYRYEQPAAHYRGSVTVPAPVEDTGPYPSQPDLNSRAADLAARVADLVSGGLTPFETHTTNLSAFLSPQREDQTAGEADEPGYHEPGYHEPGYHEPGQILDRAEAIRRTTARFAGNSARARSVAARRAEEELGAASHSNHWA